MIKLQNKKEQQLVDITFGKYIFGTLSKDEVTNNNFTNLIIDSLSVNNINKNSVFIDWTSILGDYQINSTNSKIIIKDNLNNVIKTTPITLGTDLKSGSSEINWLSPDTDYIATLTLKSSLVTSYEDSKSISFTTLNIDLLQNLIVDVSTSTITHDSAIVNWNAKRNDEVIDEVIITIVNSLDSSDTISESASIDTTTGESGEFNFINLKHLTTYNVNVHVHTTNLNEYNQTTSFTTLDINHIYNITITPTNITQTSVIINWKVESIGDETINESLTKIHIKNTNTLETNDYDTNVDSTMMGGKTSITGLEKNTIYEVNITITSNYNNTYELNSPIKFTTKKVKPDFTNVTLSNGNYTNQADPNSGVFDIDWSFNPCDEIVDNLKIEIYANESQIPYIKDLSSKDSIGHETIYGLKTNTNYQAKLIILFEDEGLIQNIKSDLTNVVHTGIRTYSINKFILSNIKSHSVELTYDIDKGDLTSLNIECRVIDLSSGIIVNSILLLNLSETIIIQLPKSENEYKIQLIVNNDENLSKSDNIISGIEMTSNDINLIQKSILEKSTQFDWNINNKDDQIKSIKLCLDDSKGNNIDSYITNDLIGTYTFNNLKPKYNYSVYIIITTEDGRLINSESINFITLKNKSLLWLWILIPILIIIGMFSFLFVFLNRKKLIKNN